MILQISILICCEQEKKTTLAAIFENPVRPDILLKDIESVADNSNIYIILSASFDHRLSSFPSLIMSYDPMLWMKKKEYILW